MIGFSYEQRLISTNRIAKDWIAVSLITDFSCTDIEWDIIITSLVDKITIQKIVVRHILFGLRRFYCFRNKKERLREICNSELCRKDICRVVSMLHKEETRYLCIYHLSCDKTLALNESFSVNYGIMREFEKKLYRVSIITDKGSFDYFYQ